MTHTIGPNKFVSTVIACLIAAASTGTPEATAHTLQTSPKTAPVASEIAVDQPQPDTGITIVNPEADPGMVDVIAWVEDAFTARLDIPNVTIHVGGSGKDCDGNRGIFRDGANPTIWICDKWYPNKRFITSDRLLIAHELAHAWTAANLNDATRQTFSDLYNINNWNDHDQPHNNRGIERAADIIATIIVDPTTINGQNIYGYQQLTHNPAPNEICV